MNDKRSDTWSLCLDDGLRWDADSTVVQRQLTTGQAIGPAVVVTLHHWLTAVLRPLTHCLTGFYGLMLEVNGANGSIHGTQEEEQIRTTASTWTDTETQTGVLLGLFSNRLVRISLVQFELSQLKLAVENLNLKLKLTFCVRKYKLQQHFTL